MKFAKKVDLADLKSETDKLDIDDLKTIPVVLTHFRPMFHLCRNQKVGFYQENVWKTPVDEWHFKDLRLYLKCHSSTGVFQTFC